jgi:biopolymer transport protein ExbD
MRLSGKKRKRNDAFDIVITSMLDINFLLIMFFMMTAQFQKENRAPLELPPERGEQEARHDEAGLVINITSRGEIIIGHDPISLEELKQRVQMEIDTQPQGKADTVKLMVRCDKRTVSEQFNKVVAMLRELGVGTIRIATEMPV